MNIKIDPEMPARAARLLTAMSNPHRLLVLCVLHEGEMSVGELQARVGISQSNLSQQLGRLRRDGLVRTRRESQKIFYALANEDVTRVISVLHDIYCGPDAAAAKR